jgi:hypothetical protein
VGKDAEGEGCSVTEIWLSSSPSRRFFAAGCCCNPNPGIASDKLLLADMFTDRRGMLWENPFFFFCPSGFTAGFGSTSIDSLGGTGLVVVSADVDAVVVVDGVSSSRSFFVSPFLNSGTILSSSSAELAELAEKEENQMGFHQVGREMALKY